MASEKIAARLATLPKHGWCTPPPGREHKPFRPKHLLFNASRRCVELDMNPVGLRIGLPASDSWPCMH